MAANPLAANPLAPSPLAPNNPLAAANPLAVTSNALNPIAGAMGGTAFGTSKLANAGPVNGTQVVQMMQHPVMQEMSTTNPGMAQMLMSNPPLLAQLLQEHDEAEEIEEDLSASVSGLPSAARSSSKGKLGVSGEDDGPPGRSGEGDVEKQPAGPPSYAEELLKREKEKQKRHSLTRR
ncbi:unnamed protein product, partial [Amoebophrya sp. A25]|eukprot:GSA25T00018215001.1